MGMVTVNGKIITEMGYKVAHNDLVKYDGQLIRSQKTVYILLNKPKGFISAFKKNNLNKSVNDLIKTASKKPIPPMEDMGRQTSGLLFFTNDETIYKKLSKARSINMLYHIIIDKSITSSMIDKLKKGVIVYGKKHTVKSITQVKGKLKNELGVEVLSISPSILTKMFLSFDLKIDKLDRVIFGGLTKKNLPRGNWRNLSNNEVNFLNMIQ